MTAFSGTDPIKLSDFQGVDWLHAIKISIKSFCYENFQIS